MLARAVFNPLQSSQSAHQTTGFLCRRTKETPPLRFRSTAASDSTTSAVATVGRKLVRSVVVWIVGMSGRSAGEGERGDCTGEMERTEPSGEAICRPAATATFRSICVWCSMHRAPGDSAPSLASILKRER